MSHHKKQEHLNTIKGAIDTSHHLSEDQKSESMKRIEEWVLEDKAFGILEEELAQISSYFNELFSELGLK